MKISIGLDVCVGQARINHLKNLGYRIAYVAKPGESDDDWVNKSFANGALFLISTDLDIPRIIERACYPMVWIEYPGNGYIEKQNIVNYIDCAIKSKLDLFKRIASVSV